MATSDFIPGFPSYRTVEKTFSDLATLAANNYNIASWSDIGDSYNKVTSGSKDGYDIYALELTNKSIGGYINLPDGKGGTILGKPTLYIQGSIHPREYTTAELATRFGEHLVNNYGKDPEITWLLDYFKIAIVPIVNPDGRKIAEEGILQRTNANAVDLNRNYNFKWDPPGEKTSTDRNNDPDKTYRGSAPASEPEVQALQDYVSLLFPDQRDESNDANPAKSDATGVYIDLHSYAEDILHPWGWSKETPPNQEALRRLALKLAFYDKTTGSGEIKSTIDGSKGTGYSDKAYNVAQDSTLYTTSGGSDDWAYGTLGVAAYTFEIGNNFFEDPKYFEEQTYPQNLNALIYAAKSVYRPYMTPFGPESLSPKVNLSQVVAGVPVVLSSISDATRYADSNLSPNLIVGIDRPPDKAELPQVQPIKTARYTIDSPSWIKGTQAYALHSVDGEFDSTTEKVQGIIDTTGLSVGRHTIFVESQDTDGNWGVPTAVFLDIKGIGDTNDNLIIGNNADNVLSGLAGNDNLYGQGGNDTLFGGVGKDTLHGGDSNDSMYGEDGDDTLYGDADSDFIDGGTGDDVMSGGAGNDTFIVDSRSDSIIEKSNGGNDTVRASTSYILSDNLEDLVLEENEKINGTGNNLNNHLTGNVDQNYLYAEDGDDLVDGNTGDDYLYGQAGNDSLLGGIGKDWLIGGAGDDSLRSGKGHDHLLSGIGNDSLFGGRGRDWLTGGAGSDNFELRLLKRSSDVITDFKILDGDRLLIAAKGASKDLKIGKLAAEQFVLGAGAKSESNRVIYNPETGRLFFDADGTGDRAQVVLATLSKGLNLNHRSISVMA